jgi:L-ascorbate metabolism protein UlaG (beta-lactamase superfamily)
VIKPVLQDEAFLADVAEPLADDREIRLWWLGQSGFLIKWHNLHGFEMGVRHLLIDPYLSDSLTAKYAGTSTPHTRVSERVVDPARLDFIDLVTSSHNHTDHLDADTLRPLLQVNPELELIAPQANVAFAAERLGIRADRIIGVDAGQQIQTCGPVILPIAAAHDTLKTDAQGRHHYLGYGFELRPFRMTVYHSGDTIVYDGLKERLRKFDIGVALLPINGKLGNMNGADAARLAKDIGAKLVIPCHYDMFEFNTADPREEFIPECERLGQPYRVLKLGERLTLDRSESAEK